jgi:hypothetical protein
VGLKPWAKPAWVEDDSGLLPYEQALYVTSEDDSVTLTYTDLGDDSDPAGVGATQIDLSAAGGGGSLEVTDGTTTVHPATEIDFTSGATVTDAGGGKAEVAVTGGGGGGNIAVHKAPFDYTIGAAGENAPFTDGYTPAAGHILLDFWVEIVTQWDGTTPQCDFGFPDPDNGIPTGWLFQLINQNSPDLLSLHVPADEPFQGGTLGDLLIGASYLGPGSLLAHDIMISDNLGDGLFSIAGANLNMETAALTARYGNRWLPAKFSTNDPIQLWVSEDATVTGASPGSTQGQAILYVMTAAP